MKTEIYIFIFISAILFISLLVFLIFRYKKNKQPVMQPPQVTQPVMQPQQVMQPLTQPVTQPVMQPVMQPVIQPVMQQVMQPVTQLVTQQVMQSSNSTLFDDESIKNLREKYDNIYDVNTTIAAYKEYSIYTKVLTKYTPSLSIIDGHTKTINRNMVYREVYTIILSVFGHEAINIQTMIDVIYRFAYDLIRVYILKDIVINDIHLIILHQLTRLLQLLYLLNKYPDMKVIIPGVNGDHRLGTGIAKINAIGNIEPYTTENSYNVMLNNIDLIVDVLVLTGRVSFGFVGDISAVKENGQFERKRKINGTEYVEIFDSIKQNWERFQVYEPASNRCIHIWGANNGNWDSRIGATNIGGGQAGHITVYTIGYFGIITMFDKLFINKVKHAIPKENIDDESYINYIYIDIIDRYINNKNGYLEELYKQYY